MTLDVRTVRANRWLVAAALGCVFLSSAAAQSPAARVIALTGQVSVLRDSGPWVLNVGDSVQPKQILITGPDGFARFQLADGSTFEVFPNSKTIFRDNGGDWRDLLNVLIGRVKVHIQKLTGGQPNPNRVRTPTALISVRGTIFDVAVEDEDDTTLVSVEEGQVIVRNLVQPSEKEVNAGEWIRVYKNQPLTAKSVDRGAVVRGALRAAADAMYQILLRTNTAIGGAPGGAPVPAGGNTDHGKQPPAAPAPPPPPPAAPPPPPPAH